MKRIINNRWMTIVILLLLTANIVTLVMMWTSKVVKINPPAGPEAHSQVFEFITASLQLDSGQQQAYKILREEHQRGQRPLQDSIRKAKDNFFMLLQQASATDTSIYVMSSRVAAAEQQLDIFTFRHFQKLRAICNPGQQQKFDSIIKDVLRRMAPGRRPPPPPGMDDRMPLPGGPPPGFDEPGKIHGQ